jgi:hypothetical protein
MIREPGSKCRIRKQGYDPSPREIADNRSVSAIASKSPIVDADDGQRMGSSGCRRRTPEATIIADRQHQPPGENSLLVCRRVPIQMVDDALQPCRPARRCDWAVRTLSPNRSAEIQPTMRYLANKPARDHAKAHLFAGTGRSRLFYRLGYRFLAMSSRTTGTRPFQVRIGLAEYFGQMNHSQ